MAAVPGNPTTIDYSGLAALLPAYQAEYAALAPSIERSVANNAAARGMANSGSTQVEAAQQEQQLLASLANASAGTASTEKEAQANRDASSSAANKQMIGNGISAGLGGLGSLGGMYYMLHHMGGMGGAGGAAGLTGGAAGAPAAALPTGVNGIESIDPSVSGAASNMGPSYNAPSAPGAMEGSPIEGAGLGLAGAGLGYGLGNAIGGKNGGIYGGLAGGLTGLGSAYLMGAFS